MNVLTHPGYYHEYKHNMLPITGSRFLISKKCVLIAWLFLSDDFECLISKGSKSKCSHVFLIYWFQQLRGRILFLDEVWELTLADCAHLRMRKAMNSDPVTPFSGKCVCKLRMLSNQLAACLMDSPEIPRKQPWFSQWRRLITASDSVKGRQCNVKVLILAVGFTQKCTNNLLISSLHSKYQRVGRLSM